MKKNKLLLILFALVFLMQACLKDNETTDQKKVKENDEQIRQYLETNGESAERTSEGLYYKIIKSQASNIYPKTGDQVYVHYVGRLLDGTVFDSTEVKAHKPFIFSFNSGGNIYRYGFNQGIGLMQKGDTAKFYIPSNLAFGNEPKKAPYNDIPAYSVLQFNIKLIDILTEDESLKKYIIDSKLKNVIAASSGLYVYIDSTKTGTGETPKSGQTVSVKYTGSFLTRTVFDKSSDSNPFSFKIGSQGVIPGFEEGISLMKKGGKATILIPSKLAYGAQGSASIPPNTPLIFEVELLDIIE